MPSSIAEDSILPSRFEQLRYGDGARAERKVIGPREIYGLFRRRFRLITGIVLLGTLLSVWAAFDLPKAYTARSMIVLRSGDPNLLENDTGSPTVQQPVKPTMDTASDLMLSRGFLGHVVDKLGLVGQSKFNGYLPKPADEAKTSLAGWPAFGLSSMAEAVGWRKAKDRPLPEMSVQRDSAISALLSKVAIARNGDSMAMSVSVRDDNAATAASLVNAITRLFVEWSRDQKREDIKSAANFLRQQARELASNIAGTEREIVDYSTNNRVSSDPRDDLLRLAMQQANEQLSTARGDLTQAQSKLAQVQQEAAGNTADSSDPLLTSGFLTTLRNDEATALRDRAQLARNFGENHPLLQEADAKIASVRSLIAQEKRRIIANLENDVRVAEGRVNKVSMDLSASDQVLRSRSLAEIRLRELDRDLQTEQKLYDVVSSRLGKLDPYASVADPGARVVSQAEIPTTPSFPKPRVLVIGGFTGSLVIAFLVAMTLDGFDTRIFSAERSSALLRAPLLASIPRMRTGLFASTFNSRAILQSRPHSVLGKSFRSLYNACRRSLAGQRLQVLMISSALPSEGRTTTAVGLACTAAADGARTVLLDLDQRSSVLRRTLGCRDDLHSLKDYLEDRCALNDILHVMPDVPNLDLIMAEACAGPSSAPLRLQQLDALLSALRNEYDVVVIDAPPLLVVDDAIQIASFVDTVILVVAYGRTTEDVLNHARERLHLNKIPLTGVVVNRVDPKARGEGIFLAEKGRHLERRRRFA